MYSDNTTIVIRIQIDYVQYLFQTASLDVFTPTLRDDTQCGTHATTALLPILG